MGREYKIVVRKCGGKILLGRFRIIWDDIIEKCILKKVVQPGLIRLRKGKFRVSQKADNLFNRLEIAIFSKRNLLCGTTKL